MPCAKTLWVMLVLLPTLGGCAAVGNLGAEGGAKVYGGTRVDLSLISGDVAPDADAADLKKIEPPVRTYAACCGLVDLPFSFVADTLMLPVTLPLAARDRRHSQDADEQATDDERY